eukprot:CAMPEP_0173419562 /NCGR_PEP_ID=MMETSP1357-20121228/1348_1 /TAXON_ID=77926 /ORGANISM="Hemiselmis rufescens, Strain PCC563" /LENGTH=63 /DNA_ID=CAMNT_0014382219 /DNA_START=26 /DNA_END=217 /DNA_ORIENTATION=-
MLFAVVPINSLASPYGSAPSSYPSCDPSYLPFHNNNFSTTPDEALQYWMPGSMDSPYYVQSGM